MSDENKSPEPNAALVAVGGASPCSAPSEDVQKMAEEILNNMGTYRNTGALGSEEYQCRYCGQVMYPPVDSIMFREEVHTPDCVARVALRLYVLPNAELCQPCPPSTPPRQETADGQGLA
jgi:hypothetical protein